jgi:hypothetical protein
MGKGHDLDGLIRFISRDEVWSERLAEIMEAHLGPAMAEFDLDFEELGEILGPSWPMVLWGSAFEDLLGRRFGPEDENVAELYLKRRGWKESALNRAYIEGLRDAPASLYEVSEIRPGESMRLRDLLTGAPPVTVRERSATRSLKPWDRIAVRVVSQRDWHVISGALLPFPPDAVELLMDGLRHALGLGARKELRLTQDQLRDCAPLFANAWLFSCLPTALYPAPIELTNGEGDELLFHDLRFPLAAGVVQRDIVARLSEVAEFEPAGPKAWTWLETDRAAGGPATTGLALDQSVDGTRVLGMLALKGRALTLSVNSERRAQRGAVLIGEALGDLVKPPLTAIRTVEQLRAEGRREDGEDADDIPPEIARRIAHDVLDRHYREVLDQPIPALGDRSPRHAAHTESGRRQVIDWLKLIENRSASQPGTLLAEYDFAWMWEELGLAEEKR